MVEPVISFIIPVYNGELYIARCINSILSISNDKCSIEVVVVNDGSLDGTEDICRKIVDNDSRLKYFYQENSGVSSARNRGIIEARGKYIIFIDSDDEFIPEHLYDYLPDLMNDTDTVYVYDYYMVDVNGDIIKQLTLNEKEVINAEALQKRFIAYPPLSRLEDSKSYLGAKVFQYILPRNILLDNNITFNEKISFAEDMCFLFTVLNYVERCKYISDYLYKYYVLSNSVSHSFREYFYDDWNKVLGYLRNYIKNEDEYKAVKVGVYSMIHHYYANHYDLSEFCNVINAHVSFTVNERGYIRLTYKPFSIYSVLYKFSLVKGYLKLEYLVIKLLGKLLRFKDKIIAF